MQKNTSFRQCPLCDLKNCYRLLQFSSFALRKRATHLIWFKFFLTDSPCFLSVNISSTNPFYYFYIHTHFVEPLQWGFSGQYTLKKLIKTLRIITNKTLKRIKKICWNCRQNELQPQYIDSVVYKLSLLARVYNLLDIFHEIVYVNKP